jgi:hypothetical protein
MYSFETIVTSPDAHHMNEYDLEALYERNDGDVKVTTAIGERTAISHFLKFVSPMFDKALTSKMREGKEGVIDLSHYNPEYVDVMLRCIHYDTSGKSLQKYDKPEHAADLCELYTMADCYEVTKLKERVGDLLLRKVSTEDGSRPFGFMYSVFPPPVDESTRRQWFANLLHAFDKYGGLFDSYRDCYIQFIVSMVRERSLAETFCRRVNTVHRHSWCCEHPSGSYPTAYEPFRIWETNKYGCICTYFREHGNSHTWDYLKDFTAERDKVPSDKYFTGWCCRHNPQVQRSKEYDKKFLLTLPAKVRERILDALTE